MLTPVTVNSEREPPVEAVTATQPETVRSPVPRLWRFQSSDLAVGDIIEPGRWGQTTIQFGAYRDDDNARHRSAHFHREHLLELFRVTQTSVPVSRLMCAYGFESLHSAITRAIEYGLACYEVEPVDLNQPTSRHDMVWITQMGEPGAGFGLRCQAAT
jgi:hypothetical protein